MVQSRRNRFVISIPHLCGVELIRQCVESAQAACGEADSIHVVTNGTTDGSIEMLKRDFPQVCIVENEYNEGFSKANNQIVRSTDSEFVLFLNSDARISPDTLDRFEKRLREHPNAGIVGAVQALDDGSTLRSYGPPPSLLNDLGLKSLVRYEPLTVAENLLDVGWPSGVAMAVRREAIDQAGAMEEDFFFYYEEAEWSHRLRHHGWRTLLDLDNPVLHEGQGTSRKFNKEAKIEGLRSQLIYFQKVHSPMWATILMVTQVTRLSINVCWQVIAIALTLGQKAAPKRRFEFQSFLLSWWLRGRPASWGLPGKRPLPSCSDTLPNEKI